MAGQSNERAEAASSETVDADLRRELEAARARIDNLLRALDTNRTIGVAIGVAVERWKLSPEGAFDLLLSVSQRTNRKLRDVAAEVVETGAVPGIDDAGR
ncbi:ANTAR domain-containing protein [Jatrophihabitans fulvus]